MKGRLPMHKLWRWEENSYKQNQKRKILWTAAVICWLAALWVTFWIEHTLYGEVIETGTFTYLGCSIGMAIGYCLRAGKVEEPVSEKQRRTINMVLGLVMVVFVAGLFYFKRGVVGTQFVCVMLVAFWADAKTRQDLDKISLGACALLFAAIMLMVGTFAGPKIMGLTSTKQAVETIAEQGFAEAEYLGRLQGRWAYRDARDKSFYTADMSEEWYYMLYGEKDNKSYRFLVDPEGGEIMLAATEAEEPQLGNWYR